GGEVKIHVSQRNQALNIAVGISHPWLGNDFAESKLHSHAVTQALNLNRRVQSDRQTATINPIVSNSHQVLTSAALMMTIDEESTLAKNTNKIPRDILGLLFCCHLIELHGGRLVVQGSPSSGYRYVLQIAPPKSVQK
ncbi:MAG: histidine kinase, partial [Cyanobacteria bacterium J06631_2]